MVDLQIKPLDGTDGHILRIGIGRDEADIALGGVDHDLASRGGHIPAVVRDLKAEGVDTIAQGQVGDADHAAGGARNALGERHIVHIYLGRSGVQTGIVGLGGVIRRRCGHRNRIAGPGLAGHGNIGVILAQNAHIAEHRGFAVINGTGIVHGDVIDVQCQLVHIVPRTGSGNAVVPTKADIIHIGGAVKGNGDIVPSLFRIYSADIPVVYGLPQLGCGGGAESPHRIGSVHGQVDPHTDRNGVGKIESHLSVSRAGALRIVDVEF